MPEKSSQSRESPDPPAIRAHGEIQTTLEGVHTAESRRILATLIRLPGDFDAAEDAVHDAFAAAAEQWPIQGIPAHPRAWLVSTGRFKPIDGMRRRARFDSSPDHRAEHLPADHINSADMIDDIDEYIGTFIPHLWFDDQAEEAANFYVSVFSAGGRPSKVGTIHRYGDSGAKISGRGRGSVMTVSFILDGQEFIAAGAARFR